MVPMINSVEVVYICILTDTVVIGISVVSSNTITTVRSKGVRAHVVNARTVVDSGTLVNIVVTLRSGPAWQTLTSLHIVTCISTHTAVTLIGTVDAIMEFITI